MHALVRYFTSSDVDLETYIPEDSEDTCVLVRIIAGPSDGPGEESFDVEVCTPRWIERWVRENGPRVGRHSLIVARWHAPTVLGFLKKIVENCSGPNWHVVGEQVDRIGLWEFEDYRS